MSFGSSWTHLVLLLSTGVLVPVSVCSRAHFARDQGPAPEKCVRPDLGDVPGRLVEQAGFLAWFVPLHPFSGLPAPQRLLAGTPWPVRSQRLEGGLSGLCVSPREAPLSLAATWPPGLSVASPQLNGRRLCRAPSPRCLGRSEHRPAAQDPALRALMNWECGVTLCHLISLPVEGVGSQLIPDWKRRGQRLMAHQVFGV